MASKEKKVSAGIYSNVSKKMLNEMRKDRVLSGEKQESLSKAWREGKNPWVTIDNPNREATHKRRIRVRANDAWGPYHKLDPRKEKKVEAESEV